MEKSKSSTRIKLGIATFGVAMLPVASYAATASTSNIQLSASVGSVISINTPTAVSVSLTPTGSGPVSTGSHTVTVSTNNGSGYNLTLKDSDATLTLASGGNTIAASAGTVAAPVALAMNTYGYAITGAPFAGSYTVANDAVYDSSKLFAGITASNVQLKSTSSTASNDNTVVYWGVRADTTKPNGTYTNNVVYTATTNP